MENKLEQLLNSLIEKGWKPRDEESVKSCMVGEPFYKRKFIEKDLGFYIDDRGTPQWLFTKSLREICSKGSGLWQFCCENNLVPIMCDEEWIKHYYKDIDDDNLISGENIQPTTEYEYRLIESSLKDESELEDFLLGNIKVEG